MSLLKGQYVNFSAFRGKKQMNTCISIMYSTMPVAWIFF